MIETVQIFVSLFILLFFFTFPISLKLAKSIISEKINIFENYMINIIINSFLFLIISFFKINFLYYFWLIVLILIKINFSSLQSYYKYFSKEKKIVIFFLISLLTISFNISSNAILGWDGVAHWYYKVLNFNQGFGYENLYKLNFNIYPHLGPYIWNFFWFVGPSEYEYSGRFFYVLVYLVSIFATFSRIKKSEEIKILLLLIIIFLHYDLFLFSGYQEYFMFFMIASIPVLINLKNNKNSGLIVILIIIALSLLPWIKREGLIFNILILVSIIFSKKLLKKEIFFIFITSIGALIFFFVIRKYYNSNFNIDFDTKRNIGFLFQDITNLKLTLYRTTIIIYEIIKASIKYPLFMLCSIFLLYKFFSEKKVNEEVIFLILSIFFIMGTYFIPEGFKFIKQTMDRLIFQTAGFYLVYLVFCINKLKFKI
jgi:hypothetical protein